MVTEGRSKLVLEFMCSFEHGPESDRPVHLIPLFQVFGLMLQMGRAKLMPAYRGLKVSFPAI
ncbi:MAG: hypothetical protein ABR531_10150, partial [Bacteroidales bacterium]